MPNGSPLSIENIPRYIYTLISVIFVLTIIIIVLWYRQNLASNEIRVSLLNFNFPLVYELQKLNYESEAMDKTLSKKQDNNTLSTSQLLNVYNFSVFTDETLRVIKQIRKHDNKKHFNHFYLQLFSAEKIVQQSLSKIAASKDANLIPLLKKQLERFLIKSKQIQRLHQRHIYYLNDRLLAHGKFVQFDVSIVSLILVILGIYLIFRILKLIQQSIDQQKQTESELQNHRDNLKLLVNARTRQLQLMNEELDSFNHAVSHDLRAPLRHIASYIDIVFEDYKSDLPEDVITYLKRVSNAAKNTNDLVNSLLDLSRLTRKEIKYDTIYVDDMLQEIIQQYKDTSPERIVDWKIDADIQISADPILIKTVFDNLIDNAWKYTSKIENATIEITAIAKENETIICIKDNGAGFDMQYADKLFGPFQRMHSKEEYQGMGVGLSTVKRIIHLHNGRVWANAIPNQGATFCFAIPTNSKLLQYKHNGQNSDQEPNQDTSLAKRSAILFFFENFKND